MSKLLIAALAAMSVGACATTGSGNGNAKVSAVAGSKYCQQSRLAEVGTRFNCNWSSSRAEACAGNAAFSTLDIAGHAGPFEAAACENGHRLVELRPKA